MANDRRLAINLMAHKEMENAFGYTSRGGRTNGDRRMNHQGPVDSLLGGMQQLIASTAAFSIGCIKTVHNK